MIEYACARSSPTVHLCGGFRAQTFARVITRRERAHQRCGSSQRTGPSTFP
jgi:hypothetical protein